MIHANRIVTVGEQESTIDRPIILYRGDREVEIEFTLVGNEFMFSEEGNVIKSVNASHGQLVLNTPSGEHMFSELAECHEGKVVFVVTKEMIDEFIEMGFYSFQIRLYDSAEMKSRVTIPPVMNGFDIRNPIAAEDEVNIVDQGLVDYARVFKDQSNEELPTFDWTGAYNKTEWEHHDVITENKMNKIEDALYSINANIKESDVFMLNALDNVKKDADKYVKDHMAEVEADVEEFERNLNTDVQQFKIDTNAAMTAHKNEVSEVVDGFSSQLEYNALNTYDFVNIMTFGAKINDSTFMNDEVFTNAIDYCVTNRKKLILPRGTFYISSPIILKGIDIEGYNTNIILINNDSAAYVMYGENLNSFKISGITLTGNRKNHSEGNAVSTDGLYLKSCSYFIIEGCTFSSCKNGFVGQLTYCGEIRRCTSKICQEYAFYCSNACTSLKFDTCISWGCGGGFRFNGCVYMTIINPANDHNSAGGYSKDPWLPQGSGGDYRYPSPIYHFVGTQVSVISSGTENAFSPFIYMEGANVVMTNPYFWKSECYAEKFYFIQIAGAADSSLDIFNPKFIDIENKLSTYYTRCGIYVERPTNQKVRTNVYFNVSDTFGEYDMYNTDSLEVNNSKIIYSYNQYTLLEGQFINFKASNNEKVLVSDYNGENVITIPELKGEYLLKLPSGVSKFAISGYYISSMEILDMSIVAVDESNTETILHKITALNGSFNFSKILKINDSSKKYYLKIKSVYDGNKINIKNLTVEKLK